MEGGCASERNIGGKRVETYMKEDGNGSGRKVKERERVRERGYVWVLG